jgi:hypothetical protein
MPERLFVRLTEDNDWEGEEWHFYIPIENNGDALRDLQAAVEDSMAFSLSDEDYLESEIDILVNHSDSGYMSFHNKLDGVLNLDGVDMKNLDDAFYKGQIEKFVE